jgi:hypothetical protein
MPQQLEERPPVLCINLGPLKPLVVEAATARETSAASIVRLAVKEWLQREGGQR